MLRTAYLNILSAAIWIVSAPILFIFAFVIAYELQQKGYFNKADLLINKLHNNILIGNVLSQRACLIEALHFITKCMSD